jgi:putative membrane protein
MALAVVSPTANPWAFHAHPDTWLAIVTPAFAYWYAIRRLGPRVLDRRATIVTRKQVLCFCAGLLALEVAADWPIHDLAENYLFSAHMVEHMLISLVAPPLLLLGMPAWMTRRILRPRWAGGTVRVMCRPLVAGVLFNAVIAISHAPFWVNGTLEHHSLHFFAHLLLFTVSMFMWFPVINKLEEFPSLAGPARMIYLFLQSVIPNVPAAFLAMSTGVVYKFYASVPHPFAGLSAVNDQQLAGAIMKVGGTFYLWGIITVLFFRWVSTEYRSSSAADDRARSAAAAVDDITRRLDPDPVPALTVRAGEPGDRMPRVLTWDHVAEELAKSPPAQPDS